MFWELLGKWQERGGRGAAELHISSVKLGLMGCSGQTLLSPVLLIPVRSQVHSSHMLQTAQAGNLAQERCYGDFAAVFPRCMYIKVWTSQETFFPRWEAWVKSDRHFASPGTFSVPSLVPSLGGRCLLEHCCWVCCSLHWQQLLDLQRYLSKGNLKEALRLRDAAFFSLKLFAMYMARTSPFSSLHLC